MLEVGKLYICEEYFLLLYPDWEACATAAAVRVDAGKTASAAVRVDAAAEGLATYWSKRFEKPVYYTEKKVPLLVLNNKEEYIEVLAGDKKGWIMVKDWLGIKEIDYV